LTRELVLKGRRIRNNMYTVHVSFILGGVEQEEATMELVWATESNVDSNPAHASEQQRKTSSNIHEC
jgi:hypothetical protein